MVARGPLYLQKMSDAQLIEHMEMVEGVRISGKISEQLRNIWDAWYATSDQARAGNAFPGYIFRGCISVSSNSAKIIIYRLSYK